MQIFLFLVTNDLTYDQRMIRICTSVAKAGYKVRLIGRLLPDSRALVEQTFEQKRLRCFFNKGKLFYLEYNFRLLCYLLTHHFDNVCAIDLDTILPAYLVSKLCHKTMAYDAHEYFTEVPEVVNRPLTKKIWEWVAAFTIPNIRYCYTVSPSLAAIFSERYKVDFQVVRNVSLALNLDFSKEEMARLCDKLNINFTPQTRYLLYQGALNEGRGIEALIVAMRQITDANVELWLAGEGDLSATLRDLAKKNNVTAKVKFLGRLTPLELKIITAHAYLGLNLLENRGLSYYYSLANKAFDYVQAEIPALHCAFPEYQRLNEEFEVSILIENLEIPTIVTAIRNLLQDTILYQHLKDNCKIARKIWIWEKEEEKLIRSLPLCPSEGGGELPT